MPSSPREVPWKFLALSVVVAFAFAAALATAGWAVVEALVWVATP